MEKVVAHMIEWFERYLTHKDIITKKIEKIDKHKDKIVVTYKDKTQTFFIFPDAGEFDFSLLHNIDNPSIVMLNTEDNLNWTIKNWNYLISHVKLSLYFINPHAGSDTKWIIFPYTHHQISDSVELGLRSMFESVESTTIESFSQNI